MAQTMKIKKGDVVHVLRGKDAGKEGRVVEARPKDGKVVVENINVIKKHRRPRAIQNTTGIGGSMVPGGIIDLPAPLPVSNVMLVCPTLRQADPRRHRGRRRSPASRCASASASAATRRSISNAYCDKDRRHTRRASRTCTTRRSARA